ncbi:glycine zipper 2TM domain-containing protein [Chitinasiproducens palmae]|uniref:Osmotically inducible lipoprotein OsmB n=1 Tax=Chitinasiproducens palmae TaxID=1770053 RepID=A0A1H2PQP6_9BURK|nr:glycine zipper 2TM domain-containing protein [Chitinasiproducens palmae]SDV49142.1 osmotically inducible lipoprotein OsmB [Chitinasiproducens palmae]
MNKFKKIGLVLAVAALTTGGLTGCENMTRGQRNAAIGAGVGGVAGAAIGGNALSTVGGAAAGGLIGSQVGK